MLHLARNILSSLLSKTAAGRELLLTLPGPRREIMEAQREHFTIGPEGDTVRNQRISFFVRDALRFRAMPAERLVELPVTFQSLPRPPARLLDVGAGQSLFPLQTASLGYETHTLDNHHYPHRHPNLTSHVGDLREHDLGIVFDVVTCISTIEHVGLGAYGEPMESNGHISAMKSLMRYVRPGGHLVATFPYGAGHSDRLAPIYGYRLIGDSTLEEFQRGWIVVREQFFLLDRGSYLPVARQAMQGSTHTKFPTGCAIVTLQRPA